MRPFSSSRSQKVGPAGWLRRGLVAAVALGVAWTIVADTTALSLARRNPDDALRWGGRTATVLVAAAEQRLVSSQSADDLATVGRLAERALIANPLEARALLLMALAADLQGDDGRAESLMTMAAARTLHDPAVHTWMFDHRLRTGDIAGALHHADVLLRTYASFGDHLLPSLVGLAGDADARAYLIGKLAAAPPWRQWFLGALPRETDEPAVPFAVLSGLQAAGSAPSDGELGAYLEKLIDGGEYELAYLAWLHFLPEGQPSTLSYAYNGDFDNAPSGLPFDWMIGQVAGATTEVVKRPGSEWDRALHVVFKNTRVRYRHVAKLLMLPPGRYRLSGSVRTNALANARGLVWRVYCAEEGEGLLGQSPRAMGTAAWRPFEGSFDVPSSGCRAQWLRLELAARTAIEQQVSGEAWYDNLHIARAAFAGRAAQSN